MMLLLSFGFLGIVVADDCGHSYDSPEVCHPPTSKYHYVFPIPARQQWKDRDGYCGSLSAQTAALGWGAWISQDQVRKSIGDHEIGPRNMENALKALKWNYEKWNTAASRPQWKNYLVWMKNHIANRHPCIWYVMTKERYGTNTTGDFTHIEPVYGMYSNYSLSDKTYYDMDVLVHASDWDKNNYYRTFQSLPDNYRMEGNCRNAPVGVGRNEAYPCIDENSNDGYCVTGPVDPAGKALPMVLAVDRWDEPDVIEGQRPVQLTGTVTVESLTVGDSYTLYRFDGYKSVPTDSNYEVGYTSKHTFTATGTTYKYKDPKGITSNLSTYYRCVPAS